MKTNQGECVMHEMLQGVKVLDFTMNAAGPVCTAMLADYGASVIKVERPGSGDDNRQFPPIMDGQGFIHFWCNRGKTSITLDLKDPEGAAIAKRLALECDILVESNRPGIMKNLGLDYARLRAEKPDIVYCSVSAYSQAGPYAKKPGYDLIAQAMSGMMELNGEAGCAPLKSGLALGDYWGGLNAYAAVISAWYHRLRTGQGQHVDASLLHNLLYHNDAILDTNVGVYRTRCGNHHPAYSPYGLFQANGGQYVVVSVETDEQWQALCALTGWQGTGLERNEARVQNRAQVTALLETWLLGFDNAMDAVRQMQRENIPCCRMTDMRNIMDDAHIVGQGWIVKTDLPDDITSMRQWYTRNVSAFFSKTPGSLKKAPPLGNGNLEILQGLGISAESAGRLQAKWSK